MYKYVYHFYIVLMPFCRQKYILREQQYRPVELNKLDNFFCNK